MHPVDDLRARFEAVALPLMEPLHRVALRLTGDPEEAADAVQETYLRAYRTFENFRAGTNARSWLFTILYSVVINRGKKLKRESQHVRLDMLDEPDTLLGAAATAPADPVAQPPTSIQEPEIEAALRSLPEPFRAVVVLVDVEELSYEEAALVVGAPVGTVRSRLFRGRRLLLESLRGYAVRTGHLKEVEP
ncbi:MAG: sigma-70 family RNA polymerase sigma factor [Gemmatimonadetes bacterium]|nr:sigma-70 family RNA polymerase sigma factor [Gemmatimonadota bacterium]